LLASAALSVIQERVPPGASEVMHFHSQAQQFFFVLSGHATLELDDRSVELGARQGLHVPPRVPHRFVNKSGRDVVFLVISSPSSAGDRTDLTGEDSR
jgi:mannose-6-phosphate isomerase-like protein (cupin superfamily)